MGKIYAAMMIMDYYKQSKIKKQRQQLEEQVRVGWRGDCGMQVPHHHHTLTSCSPAAWTPEKCTHVPTHGALITA